MNFIVLDLQFYIESFYCVNSLIDYFYREHIIIMLVYSWTSYVFFPNIITILFPVYVKVSGSFNVFLFMLEVGSF